MVGYLIASLPTLRLGAPPPLAPDVLAGEVRRVLSAPDAAAVYPAPGSRATASFARSWEAWDTQLRNAVTRRRAAARGAEAAAQARPHEGYRVDIEAGVEAAWEAPDPGAREAALDALRWRLLDDVERLDPWGLPALFAYARRLELAARRAALDADEGRARVARLLSRSEATHG